MDDEVTNPEYMQAAARRFIVRARALLHAAQALMYRLEDDSWETLAQVEHVLEVHFGPLISPFSKFKFKEPFHDDADRTEDQPSDGGRC